MEFLAFTSAPFYNTQNERQTLSPINTTLSDLNHEFEHIERVDIKILAKIMQRRVQVMAGARIRD